MIHINRLDRTGLALAFAAAMLAPVTPASAQDDGKATSTVEAGVGATTDGSFKAGEYNGLEKKGAFVIGDFDVRGGSAWNSDSSRRWRIRGFDLGLESRSLTAVFGDQGHYRLNFGYDELLRNRSDSYQTPYDGAGTNTLTLPGTWLVPVAAASSGSNPAVTAINARGLAPSIGGAPYINTATNSTGMGGLLTPTAAQLALVNAAAAADVPLFHNFDIHTKRTRFDAGLVYNIDTRWAVDASVHPEHKEGTKLMGSVSRNTGGDIGTVVPDVVDYDHNQISGTLSFKGEKTFASAGYYGSYFKNNVKSMSWQNWATGPAGTGTLNTMSSPPDNQFNQFVATAGLTTSKNSKLVLNGTYGRNTQNDAFLVDPTTPVVPVSSLNGLVVATTANAKFTAKPTPKLNFLAAYRYDDRDNRTAIHIFQYSDAQETPVANALFPAGPGNPYGAVVAQNANANRPYSRKLNQFNTELDFAVAPHQFLKGGYDFEQIDRSCPGAWINCADAPTTRENTVRAEWRLRMNDDATVRVNYAHAMRRAPLYDENAFLALVPYAGVSPVGATAGATALSFMIANGWTGYGPVLGYAPTTGNMNLFFPSNNVLPNADYANNNRISELIGMRRFYVADRDRDRLRAQFTLQANDRVSLQGGVDFTNDRYPDTVYGLQKNRTLGANLEGDIIINDDVTAALFYTYENIRNLSAGNTYTGNSNVAALTNGQPGAVGLSGNTCDTYTTLQQRNNNNKLDPCLNWSANMVDDVSTIGGSLRRKGDRLDLSGFVLYSRAHWDNAVSGGNWANNILNGPGGAPTTVAAWFIPATPLPTVSVDNAEVRLNGVYMVKEHQFLHLAYSFLHMSSADWMYEGMQIGAGSLSCALPTNEQPFAYNVSIIGVSYVFTF